MTISTDDQLQERETRTKAPEAVQALLDSLPKEPKPPAPGPLSFREIGTGYRPGRSFGFSVIAHQLAFLLILITSSRFAFVRAAELVPEKLDPVKVDGPLYLPTLGGGSEGSGETGGAAGSTEEASNGLRARSHKGFAYPGPQPLVSAPPMAKLGIQTILQPMLKNPPILRKTFPLPNLAIPVPATPPPAADPPKAVMKVQSGRMAIRPVEQAVRAPKVTLPLAAKSAMPSMNAPEAVMPQGPPPPPIPDPARTSDVPASTRGQQGLLVLNAIPPPPEVMTKVPLGEARSVFAVAPGDSTIIADPSAGTKGGGSSEKASGNGTPSDAPSGDAIADAPTGGGSGMGKTGSGVGTGGAKYGSGMGKGLNSGTAGIGSGRGDAAGAAGTGGGTGAMLGSGNGSGSATGSGGFPGITIRGGNYGNGGNSLHPTLTPHTQKSYSMSITSTASSGGGLPDFGVFENEKVYTVYIDMRTSDEDTATPSWTLQYAPLQSHHVAVDGSTQPQDQPTAPYATLKQVPDLTPELAAACAKKWIVVSGVLTTDGKLEKLRVMKSPDPAVNTLITESLSNWAFQPSQLDGKPVALKVLLGIRLVGR